MEGLGTNYLLLDCKTSFFVIAVRVQVYFSNLVSKEPVDLFQRETFSLRKVEERRDYKDAHCADEVEIESAGWVSTDICMTDKKLGNNCRGDG